MLGYHNIMPALHVRNVDDAVVAALKKRARDHGRSLEAELRSILFAAAFGDDIVREGRPRQLELTTVDVQHDGTYGREEIYEDDGR